jgi:hypothetical protein
MKILEEITEWKSRSNFNHVYFTNDSRSKIYGYVPRGAERAVRFSKPLTFDVRGRKFRVVANTWQFTTDEDAPQTRSWPVTGSRGDIYTVTELQGRLLCTCSGFQFRSRCRHVDQVRKSLTNV